jgi:hypothetical protein
MVLAAERKRRRDRSALRREARRGHVGVDSLVLSPRHGRSVAGEEGVDVGRVGGDCGERGASMSGGGGGARGGGGGGGVGGGGGAPQLRRAGGLRRA